MKRIQTVFLYFCCFGLYVSFPWNAGLAQDIGECLPLTRYLRIVRGILLKGNGLLKLRRTFGRLRCFWQ